MGPIARNGPRLPVLYSVVRGRLALQNIIHQAKWSQTAFLILVCKSNGLALKNGFHHFKKSQTALPNCEIRSIVTNFSNCFSHAWNEEESAGTPQWWSIAPNGLKLFFYCLYARGENWHSNMRPIARNAPKLPVSYPVERGRSTLQNGFHHPKLSQTVLSLPVIQVGKSALHNGVQWSQTAILMHVCNVAGRPLKLEFIATNGHKLPY